ncbi:NUDIX hydrolase [Propioniciclava soli]|uniref:NUDIX domain-containing protein n=1 Tax=Propioniciclava soli TaxID=2775081 RepID=A0ABZ3C8C7_9ACTN
MHIFVVSCTLVNPSGELLVVRKRGTSVFMLPGGKVEAGETHLAATLREVREEVGLDLEADAVALLGTWSAPAANEPGWTITSDVFTAPLPGEPRACAEIDEIAWVSLDADPGAGVPLAPLLTQHVLAALGRRTGPRDTLTWGSNSASGGGV